MTVLGENDSRTHFRRSALFIRYLCLPRSKTGAVIDLKNPSTPIDMEGKLRVHAVVTVFPVVDPIRQILSTEGGPNVCHYRSMWGSWTLMEQGGGRWMLRSAEMKMQT